MISAFLTLVLIVWCLTFERVRAAVVLSIGIVFMALVLAVMATLAIGIPLLMIGGIVWVLA